MSERNLRWRSKEIRILSNVRLDLATPDPRFPQRNIGWFPWSMPDLPISFPIGDYNTWYTLSRASPTPLRIPLAPRPTARRSGYSLTPAYLNPTMAITYHRGLWRFLRDPTEVVEGQKFLESKRYRRTQSTTSRRPPIALKDIMLCSQGFTDVEDLSAFSLWNKVISLPSESQSKTYVICISGHLVRDRFANTSLPLYVYLYPAKRGRNWY